jgi:hypothetical protein
LDAAAGNFSNQGQAGNLLDAQNGSTGGVDTNDVQVLPHNGTNYLYLPGVLTNYASTPSATALNVTGDLEIVARVALENWTVLSQSFVAKFDGPTGSGRSYTFRTQSGGSPGHLELVWQDSGTASVRTATSTVAVPFAAGATGWVKVEFDADNGASGNTARFYTAADSAAEPTVWTQLGTSVVTATVGAIAVGTFPLVVGSDNTATRAVAGSFYRTIVRNGIAGTVVFDANFTSLTSGGATSFTESSANAATVTINRSTLGRKSTVVTRPTFLFGTDDYCQVTNHPLLNFSASESFSAVTALRQHNAPVSGQRFMDKTNGGSLGWLIRHAGGFGGAGVVGDGTNTITVFQLSDRQVGKLGINQVRHDAGSDSLIVGCTTSTGVLSQNNGSTATVTGSMSNTNNLRIGADQVGANGLDGEVTSVALYRSVLQNAEVLALVHFVGVEL